jgi:hypothetical protein
VRLCRDGHGSEWKVLRSAEELKQSLPLMNADERGSGKAKNSPLIHIDGTDQRTRRESGDRVIARDLVIGKAKAYRG